MTRSELTAKSNIKAWERSDMTSLFDAYGRFSSKKSQAWEYCKELCYQYHGENLKIVSHNSFIFTAGFIYSDKDTGVVKYMHITPSSNTSVDYI